MNTQNGKEFEILRQAFRDGRPIVPFLGAGISAGSGFPLVDDLRSYLLKVRYFIRYGAYRPALGLDLKAQLAVDAPENNLSAFLTDFGWPSLNQLNSDLYRISRPRSGDPLKSIAQNVGVPPSPETSWIDEVVAREYDAPQVQDGSEAWATGNAQLLRDYLKITRGHEKRWGRGRWRLATATQFALLEDLRLYDTKTAEVIQEKVWGMSLDPKPDWSRHLMQLSEGNLGLIDALMSQLGLRYAPALSHVMLAQLVRRLNIRLLLSLNFDPYVEQALEAEGLRPRVLEVTRDEEPPSETVVRQTLSLVKLHGGSHSLRLGERLDYALDDNTRNRVTRFVSDDALLLVIGFSGYERRMMQLIEHLALNCRERRPRILWMHFEATDRLPATVRDLKKKLGNTNALECHRLSDAGQFLFETYQRLFASYPKTRSVLGGLTKRILQVDSMAPQTRGPEDSKSDHKPIHLFVAPNLLDDCEGAGRRPIGTGVLSNPSLRMSQFVHARSGYHLVWIDLEEHHTVAGVITELIDKMRVHDPDLPPLVLPLDELPGTRSKSATPPADSNAKGDPSRFEKPIRFLRRALRRGRYILAFDSLEAFGREHTSHHGLPSPRLLADDPKHRRVMDRVEPLLAFFQGLITPRREECGEVGAPCQPTCYASETPLSGRLSFETTLDLDWYCAISCDVPTSRHIEPADQKNSLCAAVRSRMRKFVKSVCPDSATGDNPYCELHSHSAVDQRDRIAALPVGMGTTEAPTHLEEFARMTSPSQRELTRHIDGFLNGNRNARWLDDLTIPFYMLSIVRRPRSFVLIRNLWSEYIPRKWDSSNSEQAHFNTNPVNAPTDTGVSSPADVPTDEIDDCLRRLGKEGWLRQMGGGFYWIPHELHETAYKLLTEPLRLSHFRQLSDSKRDALLKEFQTDANGSRPNTEEAWGRDVLSRLTFVIVIHSRLARFYYLHVFHRTRDPVALHEYLYHRLSSLRYAKILQSLLQLIRAITGGAHSSPPPDILEWMLHLADVLQEHEPTEQGCEIAESQHVQTTPDKRNIDHAIERVHQFRVKMLQAFLNVFDREDDIFFSQGSADTWLAWIEQVEDDVNQVVADANGGSSRHSANAASKGDSANLAVAPADQHPPLLWDAVWTNESSGSDPQLLDLLNQLRWRFWNITGRLLRDNRDWHGCLAHRGRVLGKLLQRLSQGLGDHLKKRLVRSHWKKIRPVTDQIAERLIRGGIRRADLGVFERTLSLLQSNEGELFWVAIGDLARGTPTAAHRLEIFFESLIDSARCLVHGDFARDTRPVTPGGNRLKLRHAARDAESLLNLARNLASKLISSIALNGPMSTDIRRRIGNILLRLAFERHRMLVDKLNPWTDFPSSEHLLISGARRACDELEKERHRMRGTDYLSPSEMSVRRSQLLTLQARCLTWLGRHQQALTVLATAETGLTEDTSEERTLLALIWEYRADTHMRMEHALLETGEEDLKIVRASSKAGHPKMNRKLWWNSATSRLEQAAQSLAEAERLLRRGRRNIGRWMRLYTAKAQLEIERLLLKLFGMEFQTCRRDREEMKFLAEVHTCLHRGLEAVRGGWDCAHAPSEGANSSIVRHDREPWIAMWILMMIAGYVIRLNLYKVSRVKDDPPNLDGKSHELTALQQATHEFKQLEIQIAQMQGEMNEIVQKQDQASEQFRSSWRSLNESVGMERFLEKDPGPESCWEQILASVGAELSDAESRRRPFEIRSLTLEIAMKTVTKQVADQYGLNAHFQKLIGIHSIR